ncbi:MAG: GyrI-like domain-containing protein [Chlamydiales bacterium]
MDCKIITLKPKIIVGIEIRTSNQDGQAIRDIPALWERFYREGIKDKIANKQSNAVFALYTKYEGDHTKPYSLIVGCEVDKAPLKLPEGCAIYKTEASSYACIPVAGDFPIGLIKAWEQVWNSGLKRKFSTDLEVYDETFDRSTGSSSGVSLYIAVEDHEDSIE